MPKLSLAVSHSLTQEEAVKRIKDLLNEIKTQFAGKISDLHEEWHEHTGKFDFSAMGFPVSGTLTVKASQVEISGNLPFAAMLLKGKIETAITDRARTLLV